MCDLCLICLCSYFVYSKLHNTHSISQTFYIIAFEFLSDWDLGCLLSHFETNSITNHVWEYAKFCKACRNFKKPMFDIILRFDNVVDGVVVNGEKGELHWDPTMNSFDTSRENGKCYD